MRTTIDLPDDLYRSLKARAALAGRTVRDIVTEYIVDGMNASASKRAPHGRSAMPIIVSETGKPIRALSRAELKRIESDDDRSVSGRPPRR